MLKEGFLKSDFALNVDDVVMLITQVSFVVDGTSLSINGLANVILSQNRLTTRVHLNVA